MKDLTQVSGVISPQTAEMIEKSVTANTKKAYRGSLKQLEQWLGGRPITDALLADYITELHHLGLAPVTIAQVIAAVKWRYPKVEIVGEATDRAMAGIRKEGIGRGRGQVRGLTYEEVDRMCAYCEAENTVKGIRDAVLIRLMSDCLLRVGEAVAVNIEDVHMLHNTLHIQKSKTDQTGEGATVYITDYAMRLISLYVNRSGLYAQDKPEQFQGALIRRMVKGDKLAKHRLTVHGARLIIKQRARQAGFTGFISGHSLRVGAAESLATEGVSLVELQDAGRWKDGRMPAHYGRHQIASRGAVARIRNKK